MRCIYAGLSVALLWVAATPSVQGQTREQTREARNLFEEAERAQEAGRYAEARDLYRRSLEVVPRPGSAFNLAVCLRGTGEILQSVQTFDALLGDEYGPLEAAQRSEVTRLRQEANAEVARLRIEASGADAIEIRVDGVRVEEISDGQTIEWRVNPGEHVVTATALQRVDVEERLTVERGGTGGVRMVLTPTRDAMLGTLIVEASEPDDTVEIVGVVRGRGSVRRELSPGAYEVRVIGNEGQSESRVDLSAGTTLRVQLDAGEGDGLLASPWFWIVAGAVVAGGVVAGILLFGETEKDPIQDPVYGVTTTLTLP